MRRFASPLLLVALGSAVLAVGAAAPATSASHKRCRFKDSHIIRQTREAMIVSLAHSVRTGRGHHIPKFSEVGCMKRSGRVTLMMNGDFESSTYERLTGHIAAVRKDADCDAGCTSEEIKVMDLSTGARIYAKYTDDSDDASYSFPDIALNKNGDFAVVRERWDGFAELLARHVLFYRRGAGRTTLDTGRAIHIYSLRRVGGSYYWHHGNEVRSFTP